MGCAGEWVQCWWARGIVVYSGYLSIATEWKAKSLFAPTAPRRESPATREVHVRPPSVVLVSVP